MKSAISGFVLFVRTIKINKFKLFIYISVFSPLSTNRQGDKCDKRTKPRKVSKTGGFQ
nr:MAG TPA: hypothetical protein [Caudoviricetes sp.]